MVTARDNATSLCKSKHPTARTDLAVEVRHGPADRTFRYYFDIKCGAQHSTIWPAQYSTAIKFRHTHTFNGKLNQERSIAPPMAARSDRPSTGRGCPAPCQALAASRPSSARSRSRRRSWQAWIRASALSWGKGEEQSRQRATQPLGDAFWAAPAFRQLRGAINFPGADFGPIILISKFNC